MFLVTIDKFDLNPVPVNSCKIEPYRFVKDYTHQLVLVKLNYLLLKDLVETR
jgi:hypothetical protein